MMLYNLYMVFSTDDTFPDVQVVSSIGTNDPRTIRHVGFWSISSFVWRTQRPWFPKRSEIVISLTIEQFSTLPQSILNAL